MSAAAETPPILRRGAAFLADRAGWPLLLLGLAGTAFVAWAAFRLVPFWTWSAARLAASARLAYGFPLYAAPGDTLVNGWVYGPVSAAAYLPAIALGEPLAALRAAGWLNAGYFLAPPLLLGAAGWARARSGRDGVLLAAFGTAALLEPFGTWYGAAALGADTVATCLGALSCLLLVRGRLLPLAALLCVLAAWSKQVAAPLALAQLGWLAWRRGRGPALRHAVWLAVAAAATTVGFGRWFGFEALWHCTVVIPGRHPIDAGRLPTLLLAFAGSTWWVWPLALLAGRSGAGGPRTPSRREPGANEEPPAAGAALRREGADDPSVVSRVKPGPTRAGEPPRGDAGFFAEAARMFLIAGLVLLPGGLAAAAKAGGDQNSMHSIAYAILGGTALLAGWLGSPALGTATLARTALLLGLIAAAATGATRVIEHDHLAVRHPGEQHREAFAFASKRPGETYYPCNPLITLMAERRDYPFDYGLYDWRIAGAAPPPDALRRLLPSTLRFVIYHEKDPSREMLRVLPEFSHRRESGPWDLYQRVASPPVP